MAIETSKLTAEQKKRVEIWKKRLPGMWSSPGNDIIEFGIEYCLLYDLEPLNNEFVMWKGRPYITEAGLIKISNRDGTLAGLDSTNAVFDDPDDSGERRWIVTVECYKTGVERPYRVTVDQKEYENPSSTIWKKSGRRMTTKCGECLVMRMINNIGIPSVEEVGYDSATGTTADEARTQQSLDNAETTAEQAKETKKSSRAKKAEAANEQIHESQHKRIGVAYKILKLRRDGDSGSEALFHKHHKDLQDERFLTKTQATSYTSILFRKIEAVVLEKSGIARDVAHEVLKQFKDGQVLGNMQTSLPEEQWLDYIRALIHRSLGWNDDKVTNAFKTRFPDAADWSKVPVDQHISYIHELLELAGAANAEKGKTTVVEPDPVEQDPE